MKRLKDEGEVSGNSSNVNWWRLFKMRDFHGFENPG